MPDVENATLEAVRCIACEGVGGGVKSKGNLFIIGDADALLNTRDDCDQDVFKFGRIVDPDLDFRSKNFSIFELEGEALKAFQAACKSSSAIVIDEPTGKIYCGGWLVHDLTKGSTDGGAKSMAGSSIAMQAGGCIAIKLSEDFCGNADEPPPSDAKLEVYRKTNAVSHVQVLHPSLELPQDVVHIKQHVADTAIAWARKIACHGVGEKQKAHGFLFIVGNAKSLVEELDHGFPKFGKITNTFFAFKANGFSFDIQNMTKQAEKTLKAACKEDGAVVIDGESGEIWCANWMVGKLHMAADGLFSKTAAGSSIAVQAGGCFVIKASESICGHSDQPPSAFAMLEVFNCRNRSNEIPVHIEQFVPKARATLTFTRTSSASPSRHYAPGSRSSTTTASRSHTDQTDSASSSHGGDVYVLLTEKGLDDISMRERCDTSCEYEHLSIEWDCAADEFNFSKKVRSCKARVLLVEGGTESCTFWPCEEESTAELLHITLVNIAQNHRCQGCLFNLGELLQEDAQHQLAEKECPLQVAGWIKMAGRPTRERLNKYFLSLIDDRSNIAFTEAVMEASKHVSRKHPGLFVTSTIDVSPSLGDTATPVPVDVHPQQVIRGQEVHASDSVEQPNGGSGLVMSECQATVQIELQDVFQGQLWSSSFIQYVTAPSCMRRFAMGRSWMEAKVITSPSSEAPQIVTPKDLSMVEGQLQQQLGAAEIRVRGFGCWVVRMHTDSFKRAQEKLASREDNPIHIRLPIDWGCGEVRIDGIFPSQRFWMNIIIPSKEQRIHVVEDIKADLLATFDLHVSVDTEFDDAANELSEWEPDALKRKREAPAEEAPAEDQALLAKKASPAEDQLLQTSTEPFLPICTSSAAAPAISEEAELEDEPKGSEDKPKNATEAEPSHIARAMGKKGGGGGKGGKKGNTPKGKGRGNKSKPAQVALPPGEVTPKSAGQMMPEGYAAHPQVSSLPPHLQAEAMQQWMNYQEMQMQMMQMYGQMPTMAQAWPTDAPMTGSAPMSPGQVLPSPKVLSPFKAESSCSNESMTVFAGGKVMAEKVSSEVQSKQTAQEELETSEDELIEHAVTLTWNGAQIVGHNLAATELFRVDVGLETKADDLLEEIARALGVHSERLILFDESRVVNATERIYNLEMMTVKTFIVGEHVDIDPWERYEEVKELGTGANGKVKLARDRQFEGRFVAIKRLVCGKSLSKDYVIERELDIMKKLRHKNICKLFETYLHGRHRYFIMEFLQGGELLEELMDEGPMDEEDAKGIFLQIADALAYAHDNGIAHRDLRPENICFASKSKRLVKVIDWGHGVFMSPLGRTATPNVGTYFYQAPEVQGASGGQTYTNACDLWSLGALLYVMVSGRMPPWVLGSHQDTLQAKKDENIPMTDKEWKKISEEAKSLIKSMLKADPEERLPIKEVLQHPWLLKQD